MDYEHAAVDNHLQVAIQYLNNHFYFLFSAQTKKQQLKRQNDNKRRTLQRSLSEIVNLPWLFIYFFNVRRALKEHSYGYHESSKKGVLTAEDLSKAIEICSKVQAITIKLLDWENILLSWWGCLGPKERSVPTSKNTKDSYVEKERVRDALGMQCQEQERRDWRIYVYQVYGCYFPWHRYDWMFLVWRNINEQLFLQFVRDKFLHIFSKRNNQKAVSARRRHLSKL